MTPAKARLEPCPSAPHCVCSQDAHPGKKVAPLSFAGKPAEAWARLRTALESMPRLEVLHDDGGYLRAVASTAMMRFKDDVEFLLSPEEKVIHARSSSRLGYYDFNVNRKRIEAIRARFEALSR